MQDVRKAMLNTDPLSPSGSPIVISNKGNKRNLASTFKKLRPSLVAVFQISKCGDRVRDR